HDLLQRCAAGTRGRAGATGAARGHERYGCLGRAGQELTGREERVKYARAVRSGTMSEAERVSLVQGALKDRGIDDEILAAGQFEPRGRSGSAFIGGLIGGTV